jgi:hypothetical protein
VSIVRKFDKKYYPQLLHGFLTKHVRTSYQLKTLEENKKQHAFLTVYREEEDFHFHHEKKEEAEKCVLNNYINSLCVKKHMTW